MFAQIQEKQKILKRSPARSPQAAIAAIKKNPESALLWIDLICLELPAMEQERQKLAAAHKLNRKGVIMSFLEELDAKLGPDLNGANLRVFQESFRCRLFDVAGDPFRVGVWSEGGSFLGGVF